MEEERPESTTSGESLETMVLDKGSPSDRVFVHHLNLTSADIRRKEMERQMMEAEKVKIEENREIQRRQKEEEKRRDMEMLINYNPWGKPGGGAPADETKRTKFQNGIGMDIDDEESLFKFGRPGAGAPNRSKSGRLRTQLTGDPDIRFQDNQDVRLSIENHLRYKNMDKENYRGNLDNLVKQKQEAEEQEREWEREKMEEMKVLYPFGKDPNNDPVFMPTNPRPRPEMSPGEEYDPWGKGAGNPDRDDRGNVRRYKFTANAEAGILDSGQSNEAGTSLRLGDAQAGTGGYHLTESGNPKVRLRRTLRMSSQQGGIIVEDPSNNGQEDIYNPWGKPGAGAPFTRETGKDFLERMGWSMTGNPSRRSRDAKQEYLSTLQREMEEKRNRDMIERQNRREAGNELATLIREKAVGQPKKNPSTGELARNPRIMSDVTAHMLDIRRAKSHESLQYHDQLAQQAAERHRERQEQREQERQQTEQHLNTWETFWGKPGNGAPRDVSNHKKENLNALLNQNESDAYVKHYVREIVPSKHKNRYEFVPTDSSNSVIKKEYEFRTPWAAIS